MGKEEETHIRVKREHLRTLKRVQEGLEKEWGRSLTLSETIQLLGMAELIGAHMDVRVEDSYLKLRPEEKGAGTKASPKKGSTFKEEKL